MFNWAQLEQKFHEYFYSDDTELRISHLTAIKQKHNELVVDYIRRFRDIRNRCFNLNISDKDRADAAYSELVPHIKEKLESHVFLMLAKSCSRLWIAKAEPKSLEDFLGVVKRLGMSITLIWSNIVVIHRMTKRPACV
jgi:hypothetical protein